MQGGPTRWVERLFAAFSRLFLISIGVFSLCWAAITFPVFWNDARLDYVADRILDGERFKPETLQLVLAGAGSVKTSWPRPEAIRSAAIIRLRLAEESTVPKDPAITEFTVAQSIRRSLSAAPADSFLWLELFRLERSKGSHGQDDFAYLRMSYLLGPHEGWVAVERNKLALEIFTELPGDVAEMALTEFKDLVASAYYDEAVQILVGSGWPMRDILLRRLEDAPLEARRQFATSAARLGYDDISVPGIEQLEPRPWR
jgi:hypothetical protein